MPLTEATLVDNVKLLLGFPVQKLELIDDQILKAIDQAMVAYNHWKPRRQRISFNCDSTFTYHVVPPGTRGVKDVDIMPFYQQSIYSNLEARLTSGGLLWYQFSNRPYRVEEYGLLQQWVDLTARVLNSNPTYYYYGNLLVVFSPTQSSRCSYEALMPCKLEEVPEDDWNAVENLAVAKCKQILSQLRGKYPGGIPVNNSFMQLNGQQLAQEGKEEWQYWWEYLKNTTPAYEPIIM